MALFMEATRAVVEPWTFTRPSKFPSRAEHLQKELPLRRPFRKAGSATSLQVLIVLQRHRIRIRERLNGQTQRTAAGKHFAEEPPAAEVVRIIAKVEAANVFEEDGKFAAGARIFVRPIALYLRSCVLAEALGEPYEQTVEPSRREAAMPTPVSTQMCPL
jgi:hypothetical protein